MTERIGALLTELADLDAPPVPAADPIWRRAGRTRIRRRTALAAAAVALGAAALALTTLSTPPIIGPAGPPADGGVGGLEPLPPRFAAPFGEVPTISQRPTDRVQLLVETKLFERRFFLPRTKLVCLAIGCSDHSVPLGVGSDHAYRHVIDPRRVSGPILLAPDGRHAAAVASPLMYPVPSEEGRLEEGAPTVERGWVLIDLTAGDALPSVQCTGSAGWTRDGWFVCIPEAAPLMRYRIEPGGGVAGAEIDWTNRISNTEAAITPNLLGPNAEVLLVPGARPGTVAVIDRHGRVLRTIPYPEPIPVVPIGWCGPDSVVISELNGPPTVIGFDGVVRASGRV